ncbi:MAG: type III-B CRISPR module-associated protein Cmr3 [Thermoplasmata archaeon]|nr:type III-B CRISPR module-associated protein Cmr3 [Thermoplasmata archaeon]
MKRFFIEPLDVLMFRSERSFTAGESHVAKFSGVISPLTFEGAIKSKIFSEFCRKRNYSPFCFQREKGESEEEFKERIRKISEENDGLREFLEAIGHSALGSNSSIQVLGVFFSKKGDKRECFPMPNDIVKKDSQDKEILKLTPILKEEFKISGTEKYVCFSACSKIENVKAVMSFDAMENYLWGEVPDEPQYLENLYVMESRVGIRLEGRTKTTVEGHLYTAEFLRLKKDWGFIVWIEGNQELFDRYLSKNEIIRLGGEGRGAICVEMGEMDLTDKLRFSELVEEINKKKKFKLYLASPSYFNGYEPPRDRLEGELGVRELKLRAALPGKPIYIGGYDFAMNIPKPLRRWVNAGAVYYYEFEGEIKNELKLPIRVIGEGIDMRCALIGRW